MKGSLIILGFFLAGALVGLFRLLPPAFIRPDITFIALGALLFAVGFSIGHQPGMFRRFTALDKRFLLLPLATIIGTLAGSGLGALLLSGRALTDCLAIGSGFGYYSLSSVFITNFRGAELGTIALLSNILREVMTLLLAPLMVKYFGPLAPISSGGATTMDTTLPVILRSSGETYMMLSFYHGFIVDFSVPFLVTFFCSLA